MCVCVISTGNQSFAVEVAAVARKLGDMVINVSHLRLFNDLYAVEKTTRMTLASKLFHFIQIIRVAEDESAEEPIF